MFAKIKSATKPLHIFAGLFCMIMLAWSSYPHLLIWLFSPDATLEKLGPFGDLYGGLNTLFSGFALAGLVLNFHLQRIQFEHLSKQESENRDLILQQSQIMAMTALAELYATQENELFQFLKEISPSTEDPKDDPLISEVTDRIAEIVAEKNKYINKLVNISKGT